MFRVSSSIQGRSSTVMRAGVTHPNIDTEMIALVNQPRMRQV